MGERCLSRRRWENERHWTENGQDPSRGRRMGWGGELQSSVQAAQDCTIYTVVLFPRRGVVHDQERRFRKRGGENLREREDEGDVGERL